MTNPITREKCLELAHEASPDLTWYAADDPSNIDSDEAVFIERLVRDAVALGMEMAAAEADKQPVANNIAAKIRKLAQEVQCG